MVATRAHDLDPRVSLEAFHPVVRTWFERTFPEGPSEPQAAGWPVIRRGGDALIAAPTGTGKTLTGFLTAIDDLYRRHDAGEEITGRTQVVYVSPLKALAVDIHHNLIAPLEGIAAVAAEFGLSPAPITHGVRTGDTPPTERQAMVKSPPNILVTTPESLYLYVTAERSRATLAHVETVIVDEIHAMARDKRGSHLAVTLERLDAAVTQRSRRPTRIGLSATVKPLDTVARFLTGTPPSLRSSCAPVESGDRAHAMPDAGDGASDRAREGVRTASPKSATPYAHPDGAGPAIVNVGHRRPLDVSLEMPDGELGAALSADQRALIVSRIAAHVADHRTTLVFVNTRKMSERIAHELGELLGDDRVAAHHGSLSRERRQRVENRLRDGDLKALVATASLELGIDVGPVELVCQLGSPRNIGVFLQRVGRANHHRSGVPKGILYPTTRDELVESAALLAAVRAGRLDALAPPDKPLDILAQQIVAEVAARGDDGMAECDLLDLVCRAAPYATLTDEEFDEVLTLVSEGIETGRGRRMAYLHRDEVHGNLKARRGARLAALTSGGAIPESGDYRVLMEPGDLFVGTVNEDFAIESMQGDVFLLGSHPWQIVQVTNGVMRVRDATGMHPTVPFWLGEAPGRTLELSEEVSALRMLVADALDAGGRADAIAAVLDACGLRDSEHGEVAVALIVDYLAAARTALGGVIPTMDNVVIERFFDEAGGQQLVVHAPFGARLNRALGMGLRKKFCVTFDFELQAAASDDAVLISLGPQHSFPLEDVPSFLKPGTAQAAVTQAVLQSPMFQARWRWNLNRSLAVLRRKGGRINPFNIQRMEAADLMVSCFPALAACQDNAPAGPIEIPDHVLVRETMRDCLHEAMDIDGLVALTRRFEEGTIGVHFIETVKASPLTHEILNGAPFTYLDDDNEIGERRSRAVPLPRGLPVEARELGRLDPDAIARVREEAAAAPRDPDELHDLLLSRIVMRPDEMLAEHFAPLTLAGRAAHVCVSARPEGGQTRTHEDGLWCATERRPYVEAMFPHASFTPDNPWPSPDGVDLADRGPIVAVRGLLDVSGPMTVAAITEATALKTSTVKIALAALQGEGFAVVGRFDHAISEDDGEQWCAKRLLARIHAYTRNVRRASVTAMTKEEWFVFIERHWHAAAGTKRNGRAGVAEVIEQLQGFEWPAGEWEKVFAERVEAYKPEWLDDLCMSGEVVWGRLSVVDPAPPRNEGEDPEPGEPRRSGKTPSRRTPITFMVRDDLPWLLQAHRGAVIPAEPTAGSGREILDALRQRGALFHTELQQMTTRLPTEVEEGLWDGVARGLITADGFNAVRALFNARTKFARRQRAHPGSRGRRGTWRHGVEGRWTLFPSPLPVDDVTELAEKVAWQLLHRWGIVFRDVYTREKLALPWREILWALRRLEARGLILGGHFVTGVTGEQYALQGVKRPSQAEVSQWQTAHAM
ncbi:MAG TPA: DEAD/DEAH box helicase [Acidimicrobiia bacterium]|nr:DEAD/DEAH box helicase [Acidimicrobiia bacterium]